MMATVLLLTVIGLTILSSRDAVSAPNANTLPPGNNLGTDVASALKILDLASASIMNLEFASELLPYTTISYAQTIDGSM